MKEEEEKQRLEDMSEDEYDALTEEEKARVDKRRLASKKERLRKYVPLVAGLTCSHKNRFMSMLNKQSNFPKVFNV